MVVVTDGASCCECAQLNQLKWLLGSSDISRLASSCVAIPIGVRRLAKRPPYPTMSFSVYSLAQL